MCILILNKNLQVEMELALDPYSKNYSISKGEQIALNVDGNLPPSSADRHFVGYVFL